MQLSDRKQLLSLDKNGALLSIEALPQQFAQAWSEASRIEFPTRYKKAHHVVVCGMGASWLGAHIIQGVFMERLRVPIVVVHDYQIPDYVGKNSLVIASSYSGTTEETIQGLEASFQKQANLITISTGGNLAEFAEKNNLPHYKFAAQYNPSRSPRLGLGYSIAAQMAILNVLGFIKLEPQEMDAAIAHLHTRVETLKPEAEDNPAVNLAHQTRDTIPIVVAGTFLLGNAHTLANQFNETSKSFATFMHIPELNHHNLEGLAHPQEVKQLLYLFLESNLYDVRVRKRIAVTKEVLAQNSVRYASYSPHGADKVTQAFDTLLFGSFVTYYLAMLYAVDPTPNPWVDYFKKRLKELSK